MSDGAIDLLVTLAETLDAYETAATGLSRATTEVARYYQEGILHPHGAIFILSASPSRFLVSMSCRSRYVGEAIRNWQALGKQRL